MSAPQQGIQLSSPTRKAAYASAATTIMMSSEHRGNDRAFPACVTNLHIIATTHHRSVVRARAGWRSHRTRSGYVERGDFNTASLHWTMNHDDRRGSRGSDSGQQQAIVEAGSNRGPAVSCRQWRRVHCVNSASATRAIIDTIDSVAKALAPVQVWRQAFVRGGHGGTACSVRHRDGLRHER